ncbi:hypothetical protein BBJ28_00008929 [Nothophytophthora sp. Chile5]|nr:hypothetical protein BBJ28_00008929 [Nothophytophthora sp. Chile5]
MTSQCTLIADRTDDAVQMLLGFVALSSLYAKWHFEHPRRPVKVWFMDAMKQGTSAAMIHVMNILYAIGLVDLSDTPSDQDEVRNLLQCHGFYGSPPSWKIWFYQLLQWCTILTVMKFFVGLVLYAFSTPLGWMGSLLFLPVHNHPKIELLIVMIGCPLVMNMVQFWIQDSFLMDHDQQHTEQLPLLVPTGDNVDKMRGITNVSSAADMYEIL